jgi:hypothetical protein
MSTYCPADIPLTWTGNGEKRPLSGKGLAPVILGGVRSSYSFRAPVRPVT